MTERSRATSFGLYINPFAEVAAVYAFELPDGRVYIGASVNIRLRWGHPVRDLRTGRHHCPKLQAAYDEDGSAAWRLLTLELVSDLTQLHQREQWHMDHSDKPLLNVREARLGLPVVTEQEFEDAVMNL